MLTFEVKIYLVNSVDFLLLALTQFTLITAKSPLHNMQTKNIEAIKLLITLGEEDGNYLDNWWYDVSLNLKRIFD